MPRTPSENANMDKELQVSFPSGKNKLYGVLHTAESAEERPSAPTVIMLSGWSGSRLGPHRMFVKTARRLCSAGFNCLRFDFAGRGDSEGEMQATTIASMTDDAVCAMDFLKERLGGSQFILLGICSGGKVAISCASRDERVRQLVLWSAEPMGTLAEGIRKSRKTLSVVGEYLTKLMNPRTWRRIVTGQVNTRMVRKAVAHCEQASPEERKSENFILKAFTSYTGKALLIYGTNDPETCMASDAYEALCAKSGIAYDSHRIEGANHSFYSLEWEKQVIDLTADWLK
jgi:pimeloyl-ACP methyl ester carboxylesterase